MQPQKRIADGAAAAHLVTHRIGWVALALALLALVTASARAALVVERVGDGTTLLDSSAKPVFLDFFSTDGTLTTSLSVRHVSPRPKTAPFNLMESGNSPSDGFMTRSVNGQYLSLPGYNGVDGETNITSSFSDVVLRTFGLVRSASAVDTWRALPVFDGSNFRSLVSVDGGSFWAGGQTGIYFVYSTNSVLLSTENIRALNIFNGQLYCSRSKGMPGIYAVGTGLPTQGPVPLTLLMIDGMADPNPFAFQMNPAMTVCYVADDGGSNWTGGIIKYFNNAGRWVSNYTLGTGGQFGARGLAVDWSAPGVSVVYATTGEGDKNRLIRIADRGYGSAPVTLATSKARTVFRGLDFLPTPAVWRLAASGNWSRGGATPWYDWSACLLNGISLGFQNVNSGTSVLGISLTNNTTLTNLSALNFTKAGYGSNAVGTAYTVRGTGINLTGGIFSDSPQPQTVLVPLTIAQSQTFEIDSGDVLIGAAMSGTNPLTKAGPGKLLLNAVNRYTGPVALYGGTLAVNGVLSNSTFNPVIVDGGTLMGTGTITGPVVVQGGGALAPGEGIGTLTIRGLLTLSGSTIMEVSKTGTTLRCDLVRGLPAVTFGGTLTVSASGSVLAAGDRFKLFEADSCSGTFAQVFLPQLDPMLYWDTTELASEGVIAVAPVVPPQLQGITPTWFGAIEVDFSGPPGMSYHLWASSDPNSQPVVSTWVLLDAGIFGLEPRFYFDWDAPLYEQRFYAVSAP